MPNVIFKGLLECPKGHETEAQVLLSFDDVGNIRYESVVPWTCPICSGPKK